MGSKCLVWGDQHIGILHQLREDSIIRLVCTPIIKEHSSFLLINIATKVADLPAIQAIQAINYIACCYQRATGSINKHNAVFHFLDQWSVNYMLRLCGKIGMEGNDVRLFAERIQINIFKTMVYFKRCIFYQVITI